MAMTLLATMSCVGTVATGDAQSQWKKFPDLPDPVGFAGMFAGVLDGRLVTGGGSQFRYEPLWRHGRKTLNDRIYSLRVSDNEWIEEAFRLPEREAHFASANTADAIYLVGGLSQAGALTKCRVLKKSGGQYVLEDLADLPVPLVYGAAAILGDRIYVAGGQNDPAVKAASAQTWSLDLLQPSARWKQGGDLPGLGVFVPSMASDGQSVFLFGGMDFDDAGVMAPSSKAYRLDVQSGRWERIADLPEPRVGAATPCPVLADGRLLLIGGYAEIFPGLPREHPGFSEQTLIYDPAAAEWSLGPWLPKPPVRDRDSTSDPDAGPMAAAPCTVWNGHAVVIGGESRASVRTPTVIGWPLSAKVAE